MLYTGIDYHRKYSVLRTLDAAGTRVKNARIDHGDPKAFAAYFASLPEVSRVVMEACWNWGWLYNLLNKIEGVEEVVLAHPYKTRLIADAQMSRAPRLAGVRLSNPHASPCTNEEEAVACAPPSKRHTLSARSRFALTISIPYSAQHPGLTPNFQRRRCF